MPAAITPIRMPPVPKPWPTRSTWRCSEAVTSSRATHARADGDPHRDTHVPLCGELSVRRDRLLEVQVRRDPLASLRERLPQQIDPAAGFAKIVDAERDVQQVD